MDSKELSRRMGRRLKEEREKLGLSHIALSDAIFERYNVRIAKDSLINYEVSDEHHTKAYKNNGMRVEYLRYLADFYEVSADWLLGLSDVRSIDAGTKFICEYLGLSENAIYSLQQISSKKMFDLWEQAMDSELHFYPTEGMSMLFECHEFYKAVHSISKALSYKYISIKNGERRDETTQDVIIDNASRDLTQKRFMFPGEANGIGMAAIPALDAADFYIDDAARNFRIAIERLVKQVLAGE